MEDNLIEQADVINALNDNDKEEIIYQPNFNSLLEVKQTINSIIQEVAEKLDLTIEKNDPIFALAIANQLFSQDTLKAFHSSFMGSFSELINKVSVENGKQKQEIDNLINEMSGKLARSIDIANGKLNDQFKATTDHHINISKEILANIEPEIEEIFNNASIRLTETINKKLDEKGVINKTEKPKETSKKSYILSSVALFFAICFFIVSFMLFSVNNENTKLNQELNQIAFKIKTADQFFKNTNNEIYNYLMEKKK